MTFNHFQVGCCLRPLSTSYVLMSSSRKSYLVGDKETSFGSIDFVFLIYLWVVLMLDLSFDSKTSEVWMLKDLLVGALCIANGGFNHCPTWKLIQIVKKLFVLHLHFDCKPTAGSTNLDTKSLSILRACFVSMSDQWNGDAPCKSLCLLWTENLDSLNDGDKTEHQLGWFIQI